MWYDEVESKFNLKFELPVYSSATWGEIAQIIGERLNLKADHIRLREKFGTSLAKVLFNLYFFFYHYLLLFYYFIIISF